MGATQYQRVCLSVRSHISKTTWSGDRQTNRRTWLTALPCLLKRSASLYWCNAEFCRADAWVNCTTNHVFFTRIYLSVQKPFAACVLCSRNNNKSLVTTVTWTIDILKSEFFTKTVILFYVIYLIIIYSQKGTKASYVAVKCIQYS